MSAALLLLLGVHHAGGFALSGARLGTPKYSAHRASPLLAPASVPTAPAAVLHRQAPLRMSDAVVTETVTRSVVKAAGWRFTAGLVTAASSLFFTGSLATAASIVGWDLVRGPARTHPRAPRPLPQPATERSPRACADLEVGHDVHRRAPVEQGRLGQGRDRRLVEAFPRQGDRVAHLRCSEHPRRRHRALPPTPSPRIAHPLLTVCAGASITVRSTCTSDTTAPTPTTRGRTA